MFAVSQLFSTCMLVAIFRRSDCLIVGQEIPRPPQQQRLLRQTLQRLLAWIQSSVVTCRRKDLPQNELRLRRRWCRSGHQAGPGILCPSARLQQKLTATAGESCCDGPNPKLVARGSISFKCASTRHQKDCILAIGRIRSGKRVTLGSNEVRTVQC